MQVAALIPVTLSDKDPIALCELAGRPALAHLAQRLSHVARLSGVHVVTTQAGEDAPIEAFCLNAGLACHRGGEADELGRVLTVLKAIDAKAGAIVRVSAPLIDPVIVDHVANLMEMTDGMVDYIGTDLAPSYPRGMEVEAFTRAALDDADRRCVDPQERAAAGFYLKRNSRLYRLLGVKAEDDLARPDLDFSLSKITDAPHLEAVLACFAGRSDFSLSDMIGCLDRLS